MKKFKLIKEFPLSPVKGTIATFKTMQEEIEGIYDMGAIPNLILTDCTQFPEFWEEVKEPLFVTEDSVDIYYGDDYFLVRSNFTIHHELPTHSDNYGDPRPLKAFSSYSAALQYIDENKPIYSKKQIKEALDTTVSPLQWYDANVLRQKLGL